MMKKNEYTRINTRGYLSTISVVRQPRPDDSDEKQDKPADFLRQRGENDE
ncbi:hypothetical protein ACFL27_14315 [candidate division CSSED10-310 bacterium]|uniref:Uncharacterized protein n=1 Tax=candidate division CSSED10-310 bacterium TaxID=2855610 RepID=A0ABV6YZ78_UNCC1